MIDIQLYRYRIGNFNQVRIRLYGSFDKQWKTTFGYFFQVLYESVHRLICILNYFMAVDITVFLLLMQYSYVKFFIIFNIVHYDPCRLEEDDLICQIICAKLRPILAYPVLLFADLLGFIRQLNICF